MAIVKALKAQNMCKSKSEKEKQRKKPKQNRKKNQQYKKGQILYIKIIQFFLTNNGKKEKALEVFWMNGWLTDS